MRNESDRGDEKQFVTIPIEGVGQSVNQKDVIRVWRPLVIHEQQNHAEEG